MNASNDSTHRLSYRWDLTVYRTLFIGLAACAVILPVLGSLWNARITYDVAAADTTDVVRVLVLTGVTNPAHNWESTTDQLQQILGDRSIWAVEVSTDPSHNILAESDLADRFDVLVLNFSRSTRWHAEVEQGFQRFLQAGKGLVVLHAANNSFLDWPDFERILGGAWRAGSFHPPYGTFLVHVDQPDHPIMNGIGRFEVTDELYCNLRSYPEEIEVLAHAMGPQSRGGGSFAAQPIVWTSRWNNARVFHLTLGHDVPAMRNATYVSLVRRGTLWASGTLGGEENSLRVASTVTTPTSLPGRSD